MSYNSFKRVLGETSLERKCRFLFGACLMLLICGSFWWYGSQTEKLVYAQSRSKAEGLVEAVVLDHHWEKLETPESKDYIKILSSNLKRQSYQGSFIQAFGLVKDRKPQDEFEWSVWEKFNRNVPKGETGFEPPREFADRWLPGKEYNYYKPIRWQKECNVCHSSRQGHSIALATGDLFEPDPYMAGDLMALVKVTISSPDAETQAALNWNNAMLMTCAIVTVFLSMMVMYVIVRYVIVKPLKHLRDVADAVTSGDLDQRALIRTGDEFEDLSSAFNRMLRHLVEAQQELRQVNSSLDGKVDELAQANMKLYEMNRLKGDFLATISHELRTPLNSILGFSDVLGSIDSLDQKQRRYVDNIRKSGRMLLTMINDILDLAKLESGKMDVRATHFEVDQLIAAPCDMARPLSEKKNIDLEVELAPNLPPLQQDQSKIQQVLTNLLSNAIKFTPDGGRIVVRALHGSSPDAFKLIVSDTGVGIAEEDQATIFEKFRQGDSVSGDGNAMTREYSGTGLGLSIVKELCKLLGGSITLESQLGRGSTFVVTLPCVLAEPPRPGPDLDQKLNDLARPRPKMPDAAGSDLPRDGQLPTYS